MFAIYNNGRVGFRSTSDNLYNLKNVEEIHETHLKPEEGFVEYFTKYNANKKEDTKENAISAYKKMANIDTSVEIFHVKDIMTKDCIYIDSKSTIKEAYDVLFQNLGVMPNECVYIDDSPNSLRLADDIGFTPILFENATQLRRELVTLGVLD